MLNLEYKTKKILRTHPDLAGKQMNILAVLGSNAYGTSKPQSDLDVRGICENSAGEILGLNELSVRLMDGELDLCVYSLYKTFKLLLKQRADALELLYCRDKDYISLDYVGEELIASRKLFITRDIYLTLGEYSRSQAHRLENKEGPLEQLKKFATHSLRLIYMCTEALNTGELRVYRELEKDTLMWVRWEDAVTDSGDVGKDLSKIFKEARENLEIAYRNTKLPEKLDYNKIALLYNRLNAYNIERGTLLLK